MVTKTAYLDSFQLEETFGLQISIINCFKDNFQQSKICDLQNADLIQFSCKA